MSVIRSWERHARTCRMVQDLQTVGLLSTVDVNLSMITPAGCSSSVFDEDTLLGEQLCRGNDQGMGRGGARYVVQVESTRYVVDQQIFSLRADRRISSFNRSAMTSAEMIVHSHSRLQNLGSFLQLRSLRIQHRPVERKYQYVNLDLDLTFPHFPK